MRIGIIADSFTPAKGGIEIYSDHFVRELSKAPGVEKVELLTFQPGESDCPSTLNIKRIDADGTISRIIEGIRWFRPKGSKFDVIHSLSLYPGGLIASLIKLMNPSIGVFVTVYGTDALTVSDDFIRSRIRQFIFKTVDKVIFISDSSRNHTHSAYGSKFTSQTIYPGIPELPEPTEEHPKDHDSTFIVLSVTRLVKRKGIDDLIDAVAPLPDVHLVLVGDGPERPHLENKVKEQRLKEKVTFRGEISQRELVDCYATSDVFCVPSVYLKDQGDIEGLGLVFLEAQRFGLPVIGTNSGGIPEVIDDGRSGFIIEENSPRQIRDAIRRLRDDSDLWGRYSKNAKEFVKQKFSWEQCVQTHLNSYQEHKNNLN